MGVKLLPLVTNCRSNFHSEAARRVSHKDVVYGRQLMNEIILFNSYLFIKFVIASGATDVFVKHKFSAGFNLDRFTVTHVKI